MKLLIANDRERLSSHILLRDLGLEVIPKIARDTKGFLQALNQKLDKIGSPAVLFWHEHAGSALRLLAGLASANLWPTELRGVVLFRAAEYAALVSRSKADADIEAAGIPRSRIHIMSSVVSSPPDPAVVERIRSFGEAILANFEGILPYWILEPTDYSDGIFILLVLDLMILDEDPSLGNLMREADWHLVERDCAAHGIDCPSEVSTATVRLLAQIVKDRLGFRLEVRCVACSERRAWEHTRLPQEIKHLTAPTNAAEFAKACAAIKRLASSADDLPSSGLRQAAERLGAANRGKLISRLEEFITRSFRDQCGLVGQRERILAEVSSAESQLASGVNVAILATNLTSVLGCKSIQGEVEIKR